MAFLSKYGVARHIYIPMVKRGVVDHAVGADWTPSAGDVKISKDGGAAANVTNLPSAIAMGNSALWDFSITATELQAAQVVITIADSATKAVEDSAFEVETYGNASAQHEFDLDTPTVVASSVSALANNVITAAAINAAALNGKGDWNIGKTGYALSAAGVQAIWDALTSALTTATSIGKLLVDNINATISSRSTLTAANVWDALTSGLTTVGSIGKLLVDNINATISSRLASASYTAPLDAAGTRTALGLGSANLDTQLSTIAGYLDTEVAAILAAVDTEVTSILDALTANRAEPGQTSPPATTSHVLKVDYLYKSWRNKKDNDGSTTKLYADDGTTVDQKQTTSEAAGTVTKGEWTAGP